MQNNAGDWVTSPDQKLELFAQYYTQLYTSELPSSGQNDSFPPTFVPLRIPEEQPLSLNEVLMAVDRLKPNKAPAQMV